MQSTQKRTPLIIGLTGGIGAGKSTVAALFAESGVPVLDADAISRELVAPGTPLLAEIVKHFGPDIIDAAGQLRRQALRERIFQAPADKQWLEQQLHPQIYAALRQRIKNYQKPYLIVVIPLLLEKGWHDFIDRILVVDAPEQLQLQRAQLRDGSSAKQIQAIMQAQLQRAQRLTQADDIIVNDSDMAHLKVQVTALHETYSRLSLRFC